MSIKIAFLPWGDPSGWRLADYCLEDGSKCVTDKKTTLSLVKDIGYENIFIIVPWTLKPEETLKEVSSKIGLGIDEPVYDILVKRVEEYISKHLEEPASGVDIKVIVLPGIYREYSGNLSFVFKTDISNLKSTALYRLYLEIDEMLGKNNERIREERGYINVLLDTTHGVNYFTLTIFEVLDQVLALTAISKRCRILLSIYNADPFRIPSKGDGSSIKPTLYYHKIAEKLYKPWSVSTYTKFRDKEYNIILRDREDSNVKLSSKEAGESSFKTTLESAKRIITAYRLGLTPFLIHLVGQNNQLGEIIVNVLNNAIDTWRKNVVLRKYSENELSVETRKDLSEGFRLLLYAHAIFTSVSMFLEEKNYELKNVVNEGVSLADLKVLVDVLYEEIEIVRRIFEHEYRNIKKYKNKIGQNWRLMIDLIKGDSSKHKGSSKRGRVERHTIAHAGLNEDFIELKRIDNDIRVRIYQACEKDIMEILDKLFRDNLVIKYQTKKH